MRIEVHRSIISGKMAAEPSIAYAHRAVALASLSPGQTIVSGASVTPELAATIEACRRLGADIVYEGSTIDIFSPAELLPPGKIDCGKSADTLRLMMPFSLLFDEATEFTGAASIPQERFAPHAKYLSTLAEKLSYPGLEEKLPFSVCGPRKRSEIVYLALLGKQLLSGLLLTAPLFEEDTQIGIDGELPSWGVIGQTIELMSQCGISVSSIDNRVMLVEGSQEYAAPSEIAVPVGTVEPSYFLLAGALSGKVSVERMPALPELEALLSSFGANASQKGGVFTAAEGELSGTEIDISSAKDFIFHALVLASAAKGTTKINGMASLSAGMQDRVLLLTAELSKLGAKIRATHEGLEIDGVKLSGAELNARGDAQVAMACVCAGLASKGPVSLLHAERLENAHPQFFKRLVAMGGILRESIE